MEVGPGAGFFVFVRFLPSNKVWLVLLQNVREVQILRRYHIQNREDYVKCVSRLLM